MSAKIYLYWLKLPRGIKVHGLLEEFKSLVKKLEAYLNSLLEAEPQSITDQVPVGPGVYVFEENGRFIYIGHTRDLNRRLKHDLWGSMGQPDQPHTLGRKLMERFGDKEKARAYLKNCRLRICRTENEREAVILEQILIYLTKPEYNK